MYGKRNTVKGLNIMKYGKRWSISNEKKSEYISRLLPQLSVLRAKAGLSQDELAGLVGISRQTYCLTETGTRGMTWGTYLSLIMFFDSNRRTHELVRSTGVYPEDLFYQFNLGETDKSEDAFSASPKLSSVYESLDSEGRNAVKAALVMEYARCRSLSKAETVKLMNDLL